MKPAYTVSSSFRYAFEGIAATWREGHNIKIQSVLGLVAIALGLAFQISAGEWLAVIICIGGVIGGECVNTSIEEAVDLASPDYHPKAKAAKDMAAGAVLVMSFAALAVGIVIFIPRLLALLGA